MRYMGYFLFILMLISTYYVSAVAQEPDGSDREGENSSAAELKSIIKDAYSGKIRGLNYARDKNGRSILLIMQPYAPKEIFKEIVSQASEDKPVSSDVITFARDAYAREEDTKLRKTIRVWMIDNLRNTKNPAHVNRSLIFALSSMERMEWSDSEIEAFEDGLAIQLNQHHIDDRTFRAVEKVTSHPLSAKMKKYLWEHVNTSDIEEKTPLRLTKPVGSLLVLAKRGDEKALDIVVRSMTLEYRATEGVEIMEYIGTRGAYKVLIENILVVGLVSASSYDREHRNALPNMFGSVSAKPVVDILTKCPKAICEHAEWLRPATWDTVEDLRAWILSQEQLILKEIDEPLRTSELNPPQYETPNEIIKQLPSELKGKNAMKIYRERMKEVWPALEKKIEATKRKQQENNIKKQSNLDDKLGQ